jgi:excisionase family DNA binding protein
MELDNLYTVIEVSKLLKCKIETVRKKMRTGEIKGVKLGKEWRIKKKDLLNYVDEKE